jgi:molybdate-binding protein/nucleoside-triphosphatase THEP1
MDPLSALSWLEAGVILGVVVLGESPGVRATSLARLHIGHEELGLIGRHGTPAPSLVSLSRRKLTLASWEVNSDIRPLVDGILVREGMDPGGVHQAAKLLTSHAAVVSCVLRGEVDAGITTASWARRCGLPFLAFASRPLGIVVQVATLGTPILMRCWEVLQSAPFRAAIEQAGGYDLKETGSIRYLPLEPSRLVEEVRPLAPSGRSGPCRQAPSMQRAVRLALIVRPSGADASEAIVQIARGLTRRGLRVSGFLQRPHRVRSKLTGYDLQQIGKASRLPLARRSTSSPTTKDAAYSGFDFRPEAFARAFDWLKRDLPLSDVLVLDGISSLEAGGGGHFNALTWACGLLERKVFLLCVRSDQRATIFQKLGASDSDVPSITLAACADAKLRGAFLSSISQALGRRK